MNKTLLLLVSAIALATAIQPDEISPETDAFAEATQLVATMQDKNACLSLAKDFEDVVKKNVEVLQDAQDALDNGSDCNDSGQPGVKAAKQVRDNAQTAVNDAQKVYNSADGATVTIGDYSFNSLKKGQCSEFFSSSAYTSAETTQKNAQSALDQAKGALSTAEDSVKAAEGAAAKAVQKCKCDVYVNHQDTLSKSNSDAEKANKEGWTKAAHLKCVLEGTSASDCTVPSIPKVKAVTLCDGCASSACNGKCVSDCLADTCGGWRVFQNGCGLGNVALSASNSGTYNKGNMKCPDGWFLPTGDQYFNYLTGNGCQSNNAKSSQQAGHAYHGKCGWSGYNFNGKTRYEFAFSDSTTGTKPYQHAGNYGGNKNTGFQTNSQYAGFACMRKGT